MTPFLWAEGIRIIRDDRPVVDDVTIGVDRGQVLAVTGPSGSGKSTLLAVLAGLEAPDAGTVTFASEAAGELGSSQHADDPTTRVTVRPRTGLVLQSYGLVGVLTAAENVEVPLQRLGLRRREVRARSAAALEDVQLAGSADQRVELMSGGQQQRVAVARALASRPLLLVADEPTAQLDSATGDHVLGLLLAAARRGAAVVIATHDPTVAARAGAQVALRDGRRVS